MALTVGNVSGVEAALDGTGRAPLGADHHVMAWLVPEVVVKFSQLFLPRARDLQRLAVDQHERTCSKNEPVA